MCVRVSNDIIKFYVRAYANVCKMPFGSNCFAVEQAERQAK